MKTLYHGTSETKAASILRYGLLPTKSAVALGWVTVCSNQPDRGYCCLTTKYAAAQFFAQAGLGRAAVLKVELPDWFFYHYADPDPNHPAHSYRVKSMILPEYIQPAPRQRWWNWALDEISYFGR